MGMTTTVALPGPGAGSPEPVRLSHRLRRALLVVGALVILAVGTVGARWWVRLPHTDATRVAPSHVVEVSLCGGVACRTVVTGDATLASTPSDLPLSDLGVTIPGTLPGMSRMDYFSCTPSPSGGELRFKLADGRTASYELCSRTPAAVMAIWQAAWAYHSPPRW